MTDYSLKVVSWDDLTKLSEKIYNEIKSKNIEIDTLVPVLRGGMPLSLLLSRYLQNADTSCIHIRRSKSNIPNSEFGYPIFKGITNSSAIENKNILVIEDIIDRGLSLDLAIEELKKYNPKKIYITTFFNFNKDKYKDVISGKKINNYVWIVFPWEGE